MRHVGDTAMRTVKVDKSRLVETLKTNREKHRVEFQEAFQGYKNALIAAFQRRVDQAKDIKQGGPGVDHSIRLDVPSDHTDEYDRALAVMAWEEEGKIVLSMNDFNCYVLDDWDWQSSFKQLHNTYSNSAR